MFGFEMVKPSISKSNGLIFRPNVKPSKSDLSCSPPFKTRAKIVSQNPNVLNYLVWTSSIHCIQTAICLQVVRARLQDCHSQYSGALDCVRKTMRYEGVRGLYKGMTPYLFHVLPNICMVFLIYEKLTNK
jgi:hypothetical protein